MSALRLATRKQRERLEVAILFLRYARDAAKEANCPKTLRRIRLALTSAGGAQRHMRRRISP